MVVVPCMSQSRGIVADLFAAAPGLPEEETHDSSRARRTGNLPPPRLALG